MSKNLQMLLIEEQHLLRCRLIHRSQPGLRAIESPIRILIIPAHIHPTISTVVLLNSIDLLKKWVPSPVLGRRWLPIILALIYVTPEFLDGVVILDLLLGIALPSSFLLLGRGRFRAFVLEGRARAFFVQGFSAGFLGFGLAWGGLAADALPVGF